GIAITLGDLFEALTVDLLLRCRVPPARILGALREYRWMTERTALGQLLDVLNASRPVDEVSEREVLVVHRLKSAIYTVASPLKLGALLAGAREARVKALGGDRGGLWYRLPAAGRCPRRRDAGRTIGGEVHRTISLKASAPAHGPCLAPRRPGRPGGPWARVRRETP
ncbi:polyprenyl synthetase, partial [mine drainage metagenome]